VIPVTEAAAMEEIPQKIRSIRNQVQIDRPETDLLMEVLQATTAADQTEKTVNCVVLNVVIRVLTSKRLFVSTK
jgi:hypothetical protein